jgi:tetratricopeptide (TPR) repeat protein
MTLPMSVSLAVDESLRNIPHADVQLLEYASVEGRRFFSSTISRVAEIEERQLLRRLGDVQQRFGIIRAQPVIRKRQYIYEFVHQLLQQQIYRRLDEVQRAEYHLDVAEALVETFGENAAQGVLLDIARHFAQGRDLVGAASYYLRAARTVAAGGAPPEAIALAWRGLRLVREAAAEDASDRDLARLRAELIYLLVMTSHAGWVEAADNPETLQAVVAEGKAAGESSGDDELRARLLFAEGAMLRSRRDVKAARTTLEKALELARKADASASSESAATQVAIMIALGRIIDMEDLEQGLTTLRDAQELYLDRLQPPTGEPEPELARLFYRLRGFIGVAEFDRGNLGKACCELNACINGLEQLGRVYDLPPFLNYRAQVELASGDFDAAEADLRRALELALPGGWAAYNKALLGKVFLDSEKYETAAPQLRRAWSEVQAYPEPSLVIPVRAYLIEYLLRDGSTELELAEAGPLIANEVQDAEVGSFAYGVAWGESLGAELALRTNDIDTARTRSSHAVAILEAAKNTSLPIVRTEEVLWRHARVLEAAGSPEFGRFRTLARDAIARKIRSLPDATRLAHAHTPTARQLAEAGIEADNC